ncbi:MAG: DUF3046 domain-containing protein [Actinobacteria bacterium HGW-Actinobacteria-4]|nr:MAG: DUF3046 domain-containing protein [Actinobacteria bacterium HGW-Actinobacteria-4]
MRLSEFWELVDEVFGKEYSRSLARDLHLNALNSLTCLEALEAGTDPRDVWHALCDQMEIPRDQRDGGDRKRLVPPPR